MAKRIICIGNRYHARDRAGPLVYDQLARRDLPRDVELIDGGLAGLNLLRFVQGAERVVFVDALFGLEGPGEIVVLGRDDAAELAETACDHSAGLAYLLRVLPQVCEEPLPQISLVTICGVPDEGTIRTAADMSLEIAVDGQAEVFSAGVMPTGSRR